MPRRTQTRTLRHYTDAYISIHDYTEQSTQLTDPPRNAPTGLGAGGTDPKLGVVSWRTTRVVESRRFGNRCGAALARENEREASLEAMVGGAPRTGRGITWSSHPKRVHGIAHVAILQLGENRSRALT